MMKLDRENEEWPLAFTEALRSEFPVDLADEMILTNAEQSEDPKTLYLAACHACDIGQPEVAGKILKRLFQIDKHYRFVAIYDPALNRFWSLFGDL